MDTFEGAPGPNLRDAPLLLDPAAPRSIEWAAEMIRDGALVAIPTDTVYGIAAALDRPQALERIFAVKGRRQSVPLPVLLSAPARLRNVAETTDDRLRSLGARFWPGPLTVVLPARPSLPPQVVGRDDAGQRTVGVRVPDHVLAIEVIERGGGALAVTSANRSGDPPALTGEEVVAALGASVDAVLNGGRTPGGVPSTVVAVGAGGLDILREGAIARAVLDAAWVEIERGSR